MRSDHLRCLALAALSFGSILGCGPRPADDSNSDDFAGVWQAAAEPSEPSPTWEWESGTDVNVAASTSNATETPAVEPTDSDSSETAISESETPAAYPSASQPLDLSDLANIAATPTETAGEPTTDQTGETTTVPDETETASPPTTDEPPADPIPSAARFAGVWKTELHDDGSGAGIVAGNRYELVLSDTSSSLEQKIDGRFIIHTETTRAGWWAQTILEVVVDSLGGGGVDAADAPSIIFLPELTVTGSTAEVVKEGWFGNSTRWTFRIDESDPNLLHAECTWIKGLESTPFRRQ